MINISLFNATLVVTRRTKTGSDFGTPTFTPEDHEVEGFFDEPLSGLRAARSTRDQSVPYSVRRAVFFTEANADLKERDEGEMFVNGESHGWWSVEKNEAVPTPMGISHREWALQKVTETR